MRDLDDCSIDAVVCDPPYGLEFMGKEWDTPWKTGDGLRRARNEADAGRDDVFGRASRRGPECIVGVGFQTWCEAWAGECLRVLKPGGHVLAFGGTRTYHRLAAGIEDAGFEIRDCIAWIYGSGFPKSLDVSKAIDKAGGDALAWRAFSRAYAEAVADSPLTHADIDRALGIKSSSCYWAREDHRGGMPPRHHWEHVRDLLDLPDDFAGLYDEAEREVIGHRARGFAPGSNAVYGAFSGDDRVTAPATPEAERWQGWGTALKPAHEPIVVARKPLVGSVAANVLKHDTGALNVDGCRIEGPNPGGGGTPPLRFGGQNSRPFHEGAGPRSTEFDTTQGRWPANVAMDNEAAQMLDEQTGTLRSGREVEGGHRRKGDKFRTTYGNFAGTKREQGALYGDSGGASRFLYCAKASRAERNAGLEGFEEGKRPLAISQWEGQTNGSGEPMGPSSPQRNSHPTVKPIELMRWLCRLVTPPGGTVLDPFTGSGTTGCAAVLEGFDFIGFERDAEYAEIAEARIAWWHKHRCDGRADAILAAGQARNRLEAQGQLSIFDD